MKKHINFASYLPLDKQLELNSRLIAKYIKSDCITLKLRLNGMLQCMFLNLCGCVSEKLIEDEPVLKRKLMRVVK